MAPEITDLDRCKCCGMPLDPKLYFCNSCATPYKDEESVLPPVLPVRLTEGMLVAAKAPYVAPVFWTYFTTVVASAVVTFVLFRDDRPDLAFAFEMMMLTAVTCAVAARHWRALVPQLTITGFGGPAAFVALLALAPLLGVNYLYHAFLFESLRVENVLPVARLRSSGMDDTSVIFLFAVLPAATEEIGFRGLLQHWLQAAVRPWRAIVLASALFTVMHFTVLSAPYVFAVGALLGWAKWKTRSLYPSMLLHFIHNAVVVEFFSSPR